MANAQLPQQVGAAPLTCLVTATCGTFCGSHSLYAATLHWCSRSCLLVQTSMWCCACMPCLSDTYPCPASKLSIKPCFASCWHDGSPRVDRLSEASSCCVVGCRSHHNTRASGAGAADQLVGTDSRPRIACLPNHSPLKGTLRMCMSMHHPLCPVLNHPWYNLQAYLQVWPECVGDGQDADRVNLGLLTSLPLDGGHL